jgi:hypothetical protein
VYKTDNGIFILPIPNDTNGFLIVENDMFRHVVYDTTKKSRMERLELIRHQLNTDPSALPLITEDKSGDESCSESDSYLSDSDSETLSYVESNQLHVSNSLDNENP